MLILLNIFHWTVSALPLKQENWNICEAKITKVVSPEEAEDAKFIFKAKKTYPNVCVSSSSLLSRLVRGPLWTSTPMDPTSRDAYFLRLVNDPSMELQLLLPPLPRPLLQFWIEKSRNVFWIVRKFWCLEIIEPGILLLLIIIIYSDSNITWSFWFLYFMRYILGIIRGYNLINLEAEADQRRNAIQYEQYCKLESTRVHIP